MVGGYPLFTEVVCELAHAAFEANVIKAGLASGAVGIGTDRTSAFVGTLDAYSEEAIRVFSSGQ